MRDAILLSSWAWETFNVPERVALALASQGSRVLYCEMPVSRFRRHGKALAEIEKGLYVFGPEYAGAKLTYVPLLREREWKMVGHQIFTQARQLGLNDPLFLYSHVDRMFPLCLEMKARGFPLIHICMDYPEPYQYELIELSERTLVIPRSVFHKLKAKFGRKIEWIPQSIHLPSQNGCPPTEPPDVASLPHPRLGYLGPVYARLNLRMLREILSAHPEWQFIYFGDTNELQDPNAHSVGWRRPEELRAYLSSFDVGVMPYDCFNEKNLHCSPLKLFDYFLSGIPVVATPILSLSEYSDLIYFGETAEEFSQAIMRALSEPSTSPKRRERIDVAHSHSTQALGQRLAEVLSLNET
jgi:glycosyltransferase involved in cell wall biosynthesis